MFSKAIMVLALAASATAHIKLTNPVPYGSNTLDNSPLLPADFPCKQRPGVYEVTEVTQWNTGETLEIGLEGGATHGGGSCQFSVTTDTEPTTNSRWKVIHSVIGNCPNSNGANADTSDKFPGNPKIPVTMPEIPDGQYAFAWTWLNKRGNREFYMNCAPIKVGNGESGTNGSASEVLSALPDMYVNNLPNDKCSTTEGEDIDYPDPGTSVEYGTVDVNIGLSPNITVACDQVTKIGAGNGQIGSPAQTDSPAQSGTPSQVAPIETPIATTAPGYGAPLESAVPSYGAPQEPPVPQVSSAPSYGAPLESAVPQVPAPSYGASQEAAAPVFAPGASPAPESTNGDCTPCTEDGAVVCIGTSQFGICNRGCAVAQDVAGGMSCSNGVIGAAVKRSTRFPRAHLHRRHGSSRFD